MDDAPAPAPRHGGEIVVDVSGVPTTTNLGEDFFGDVIAEGGMGPLTLYIDGGKLPLGLSMAAGGRIVGIATEAGAFEALIAAVDGNNDKGTGVVKIEAVDPDAPPAPVDALVVTPAAIDATVGMPVAVALVVSGGVAPYLFASSLAELVVDPTGAVSGTPTAAESGAITVTDSAAPPVSTDVAVTVVDAGTHAATARPDDGSVALPESAGEMATLEPEPKPEPEPEPAA